MFNSQYFKVNEVSNISQFQTMIAYLGGSTVQTVVDNPITAYRQLVQQYSKNLEGKMVSPEIARQDTNNVFKKSPVSASLSGLGPRLVGVLFKRIPKFGFLLGFSFFINEDGNVGLFSATMASILSAPFINPVRMIEKQQRAYFRTTGKEKEILEIFKESSNKNYRPLFRGTVPLMGHSFVSATLGLVGQPKLQKKIKQELNTKGGLESSLAGLVSSSIVSPIYVILTNPISRLEVIMQTSSIKDKRINLPTAFKEIILDTKQNGLRGMFRGQGIGMVKAILSLTLFHEARQFFTTGFQSYNKK